MSDGFGWPPVDWEKPELVIDVSNVARADELPGRTAVDLERVPRLVSIIDSTRETAVRVAPFADRNLGRLLEPRQQSVFDALVAEGRLRVSGHADAPLLSLAASTGAQVLSLDHFRDHRQEHRWIQGNAEQFLGWEVDADGTVNVRSRWMPAISPVEVSRAVARKDRRADNAVAPWKCPRCGWGPPIRPRRCGICGAARHRGTLPDGAFGTVSQVGERELLRRVIGEGTEAIVGRNSEFIAGQPVLGSDTLASVSRAHLRLWSDGKGLLYEDLGSTNGTRHLRWDPERAEYRPRALVQAFRTQALGLGDALLLGGALLLRASGRADPWGRADYDFSRAGQEETVVHQRGGR
jgi:hypothetical protein